MILVSQSAFNANPEGVRKLAKKRQVVVVRDCDYAIAVEIMLMARKEWPPG